MKKDKIPISTVLDSFKNDSDISSTRLMSYLSWKVTKWWMIMFGGVALLMFVADGFGWADVSTDAMDGIFKFFTWSVIILLAATYTPKSIGKFAELLPNVGFFKSKIDENKR